MKRILPLILALVAGMALADSNSDYRAGSDFAHQIKGQGSSSIQGFKPQESIPGYNANPDETKYYGGVTAGGDSGLKNDGTTEWATGETGKTITESFMNKPKDILSPDAPFIQTGRDVVNRADSIVGNTGQQCSAQEISRSEYTNYTCERDLQVEQYCTRTARMELQGSTTWETRTLEYEMSQLPAREVNGQYVVSITSPVTGEIVDAHYSWSRTYLQKSVPMTITVLGTPLSWNAKYSADASFTPVQKTLTAGVAFTSSHPVRVGNTKFKRHTAMKLRLVVRVKKASYTPYVVWSESCPFSKELGKLTKTECTEAGGNRTLVKDGQSYSMYQSCWAYRDTYVTQSADKGTCQTYTDNPACTLVSHQCAFYSEEGACLHEYATYSCESKTSGKVMVCGGDVFCLDGECDKAQSGQSNDFAEAVSQLAALAAAGKDVAALNGVDEQLGLQGSVDKDVFTRLLEGRLPDGADLSRMQDGSNKHRPGYDLTFSAPKSVSMMAMLGGDKRLIDAHNQAVDFAVRQVEALASTRVMTDGQSETVLTGNLVTVHPEKSVPRTAGYSDAVSVLAQDRPSLAIVSGQGGAAGQRERVAELVMMAREQGREVQIIAADRRSQMNMKQDERLSGELITGRRQLLEGMTFTPGSTVIVDQGEKLSLKETLTLLDGAARHNVQVLITDSGQWTGTGSALMAMKDAGVNTYRWQGGEQRPATIISEPDRNVRYARLAGDFAVSVKAGEESVAQVSGVREQAILTQAIRSELKTQGVLGHPEVTMTALSPVWLDSRSRYLRDMYRPGMVMEQWNPETRSHDRYVIDRVTAQSHSLTLRDAQGETQVVRISSLDSSWSLFRPEKMPVADGERLRVTGKIPGLRVSGGDRLQVSSVSEDAMTVVVPGRAEPATLPVSDSPFTALKLENGWVETPGHSVSDSATVFASVTQMAMDNATLNGLARSGRDVRLYSSLDETRTAEKLARHPSFTVVSEQIKTRAGETSLETAISHQKSALHTPAQQAIHLALPVVESKNLAFSMVDLLTEAKSFAAEGTGFTELGGEINAQIKRGDLLYVDVAKGYGTGLLVSRASYEAEKSILRHILEGKEAVMPLMGRVPGELMEKLTSGQRAATRMILETSDRFTVVQGYAGVGKTTQFRAVMSAVNMLPESERPRVVGLGPTHRAVGEMRSAGVDAQTLASFLHDTQLQQRSGEIPDFSNTLFLLDESSMVGNTDMARAGT